MELEFSCRKADLRVHTLTIALPFWKLWNSTEGPVTVVIFQRNRPWALLGIGPPWEPGHLRGFRVRGLPGTPAPACDSWPFTHSSRHLPLPLLVSSFASQPASPHSRAFSRPRVLASSQTLPLGYTVSVSWFSVSVLLGKALAWHSC